MKKVFSILMLCSLLLLAYVGTVYAAAEGYERISYPTQVISTVDGEWTSNDEWTDADNTTIGDDVVMRSTWDMDAAVMTRWIVEVFTDTTEDTGDYLEMCLDGDQSGGTAPQVGDYKFVITGLTDLVWYEGTGTDWSEVTLTEAEIEWDASLTDTPADSTAHLVYEFTIPKNTETVQLSMYWNFRLAVYDESGSAGVLAWPPTDADVPDEWGVESFSSDPIPEGFTFVVVALLSSVAVVVATKGFRKRTRID